jgi:hypothetical protein
MPRLQLRTVDLDDEDAYDLVKGVAKGCLELT